jgi:hypothetical protein
MSAPAIGRYRDKEGARHEVVVRATSEGWQVLDRDVDAGAAHEVEALTDTQDGRPQAEAIARDYLTMIEGSAAHAGREPGEAISEHGGRDAHSHRRPRTEPRTQPARGVAVPDPAR